MSCFILSAETLYNLADVISRGINARNACTLCALPHDFVQRARLQLHSGNIHREIFNALYHLNVAAYLARYPEEDPASIPDPEILYKNTASDLWKPPVYKSGGEMVRPWHYRLLKAVHCFLYQTDQGATEKNPLRSALEEYAQTLAVSIACASPSYRAARWG